MTIDDVEFDDAVFGIPKNTVSLVMNVKIFQDGEIQELKAEYNIEEIRDAFNLFEKTVNGEYPLYKFNEDFFKKMLNEEERSEK